MPTIAREACSFGAALCSAGAADEALVLGREEQRWARGGPSRTRGAFVPPKPNAFTAARGIAPRRGQGIDDATIWGPPVAPVVEVNGSLTLIVGGITSCAI